MRSDCIRALAASPPFPEHTTNSQLSKTTIPSLSWFSPSSTRKSKFIEGIFSHPSRLSQFIICSSINQSSFDGETHKSDQYQKKGPWSDWKARTKEMSGKLAKLGLAAVLAYGLFDAVTYTTFFILAFLGYEKSTGKNPAANLQALLGIVIVMWAGNNVTRPFRVAGAAGLAPFIDDWLKKMQKYLNLSKQVYAFAVVVAFVAGTCFAIVGLLVLSRWGK